MVTSGKTQSGREAPIPMLSHARRTWPGAAPVPLTPLIGRAGERAQATTFIDRGARLLTLHGPGGIGKTRLAIQLATDLEAQFPDGVGWIPLASIDNVPAVLPAIARTLGLGELPAQAAFQRLVHSLRDDRRLLILDNVEQVVEVGSHIASLLQACPRLVIMATSRSLLRVSGEQAIDVPPLALPGGTSRKISEAASHAEACQLFVARAQAVSPGFRIDGETGRLVADICHRLDGMPLAIELAAARANHLTIPALRSRLEQRLPLLRSGARDQPARHRTMYDAIAWSYRLLSERQQLLFRRLGLWPGGCRAEVAEVLHGHPDDPDQPGSRGDPDALDNLAALVDHSLLRQVVDPDGEPRYVMLETIREFARDRLDESGNRDRAERLKATFLSEFARRLELAPLLPGSERMLALLDLEHRNIRDSLEWLHHSGTTTEAIQLAGALAYSWVAQGRYEEGLSLLEPLLADPGPDGTADRARALTGLGFLRMYQGQRDGAAAAFAEAARLWRAHDVPLHLAITLIGQAALETETPAATGRHSARLADVLALSNRIDDPRLAAYVASLAHETLGMAAFNQGQVALAIEHQTYALGLRRQVGFTLGACISLEKLGDIARSQGDYQAALGYYREVLSIAIDQGNHLFIASSLRNCVEIAQALGQPERAGRLLDSIDALRNVAGLDLLLQTARLPDEQRSPDPRESNGDPAATIARHEIHIRALDEAIAEVDRLVEPVEKAAPDDWASLVADRYSLTAREVDVLRGIVARLTDREIAGELFISPRTVGWHVTSILTKLDVTSRRAAARKATGEMPG